MILLMLIGGGMIPTPDEVLASIQTMAEGGANA